MILLMMTRDDDRKNAGRDYFENDDDDFDECNPFAKYSLWS